MGCEKLITFFSKNLGDNVIKKYYLNDNNKGFFLAKHIIFDINFIIYICINIIENDMNEILKILCGLNYNPKHIIKKKIKETLNKQYLKNTNIYNLLNNFTKYENLYDNFLNLLNNDEMIIILYNCIFNYLINVINKTHIIDVIKTINIFFDGIPTYAKIIEQRKRRTKNYLESVEKKKLYKVYFDNIEDNIICDNEYYYEYLLWVKNNYSFNKSLGPNSKIIINLSNFLKNKLKKHYSNKYIYINNSQINGEADIKIFKYLGKKKKYTDIYIHTCDTDFINLIILFQIQNDSKNIFLLKYSLSQLNLFDVISAKDIIKEIKKKYKYINNISENINISIIYDFLFIILLFGNDVLPKSLYLSTEINFKILFESHYELQKKNLFIININNSCIIDFNNLKLFLQIIKKKNTFTIILLNKNFKLPYNFILLCTNKLNYSIDDIINQLLIPYLSYQGSINLNLESNDIRYVFYNKYKIKLNPLDKLNKNIKEDLLNYLSYMFDYLDIQNYGLSKLEKNLIIDDNSYQLLYNNLKINIYNNKTQFSDIYLDNQYINLTTVNKFYNNIYKKIDNSLINKYFNILILQSYILFDNFEHYSFDSLHNYPYIIAPSIKQLINYMDMNDMNELQENIFTELNKKKGAPFYFNEMSHNLLITPYLQKTNYIDKATDYKYIHNLLNILSYCIDGIWLDIDNIDDFKLKDIDPIEYLDYYYKFVDFFASEYCNLFYYDCNKIIKI
uniref:Xrn1 N-terminal domain-containing protein n=1 Tax=viral metagenome TaxID=1070528 RepID=A0A6C0J6M7_9ZZZZ